MPQTFDCSACSGTISAEVPPGSQVQCPLCQQIVTVPAVVSTAGFPGPGPGPASVSSASNAAMGPPSSGAAVGALVCGIISFLTGCFPLGIVSIILGIRAMNRCTRQPNRYEGRGMAIAGLVLGCVSFLMLALPISILLPSLSRARELSKCTVCAANLRGIGQAMYIYALDDPGTFPAIAQVLETNSGRMRIFNPQDRTTMPSTTGIPSPTVDMWVLVRAGDATPKQFTCPSTTDMADPAWNVTAYYDFASAANLSYAYQYQHDPDRPVLGTSSEPSFPFMADANPYIKGGVMGFIQTDRLSPSRGNSTNHTNREGQNVLYQDGHVLFEKGPDCGLAGVTTIPQVSRARDNIYTWYVPGAPVDPGSAAPNPKICNLGSRSDACLVP